MTIGLTPRQAQTYRLIRQSFAEHGYPPSYGEIADALHLKSKSGVHRLVRGLVARGVISIKHSRGRGISLCDPASDLLSALPVDIARDLRMRSVQTGLGVTQIAEQALRAYLKAS